MLGTSHSWAVTMRNLLSNFINLKHNCYLQSINGYELCPKVWTPLFKDIEEPDIDFCYTMPKNFNIRFQPKSKLKLAIYNYETDILPKAWKDENVCQHLDFILPSSNFSKEVFIKNGWPEEKCIVVPHGINLSDFNSDKKLKLINDKPFRFLNISIAHYRKNINLVLDAYYQAFIGNHDVCLVLKTSLEKPAGRNRFVFEADVAKQIKDVQNKYFSKGIKDLPQIEIYQDRVDHMIELYNSCQVLVSASSSEGFGLPLLEGLAAGLVVIAPNATGQKDFLNSNNSLLVDTKIISAGPEYQYWQPSSGATTYLPDKDMLSSQMLNAYTNYNLIKEKFNQASIETVNKFTWENAAKQILQLANENI